MKKLTIREAEETGLETITAIVLRAGIVTAHCFELIGGYHTVTLVMILWSVEELISIKSSSRKFRQPLKLRFNLKKKDM